MKGLLLIASRELNAYRRSWVGPAVVAGGLLAMGLLFYFFGLREKLLSAEVLAQFFYYSSGVTLFAAGLLSLRLIAEERQTGSIVLLNTAPVRERDIVLGKYLGMLAVLALMLVLSVYMPLIVHVRGKISLGQVAVGYLGLFLLGAAVGAIGLFASSLTRSQVVAFVIAAILLAVLYLMWALARAVDPPLNKIFVSLAFHHDTFRPFMLGVLELDSVVYYLAVTNFFLIAAIKILEARRWR
jgi:ABC-2 type transport system permease protein